MKADKYKEMLEKFIKLYPKSSVARNVANGTISNEPVVDDATGDVLVNELMMSESGGTTPDTLFDIFEVCGCGDPDSALMVYYQALSWCSRPVGKRPLKKCLYPDLPEEGGVWYLILYVLMNKDLTIHGASVFGSVLSEKGIVALEILREYFKEK